MLPMRESGYFATIASSSAWINPTSKPIHELMGTMEAIGAEVLKTTKIWHNDTSVRFYHLDRGIKYGAVCNSCINDEGKLLTRYNTRIGKRPHQSSCDQCIGIVIKENDKSCTERRGLGRASRLDESLQSDSNSRQPPWLFNDANEACHEKDEQEDVTVIFTGKCLK